jgi:uncharacterized protein (TIGR02466 family)
MSYQLYPIFSTPLFIYKDFLPEKNLNELLELAKQQEYVSEGEKKVKASVSNNFLRHFPDVKEEILETFKEYVRNILRVQPDLDFKIGSSWTTMTEPQCESNEHTHANYYYSGVLYLSENPSAINFYLGSYIYNYHERFLFEYSEVNEYNSNKISYIPQKNELIFFPAYVKHQVSINLTNEDRYSMAFNIHPSGKYGKRDSSIHVEVIEDLD